LIKIDNLKKLNSLIDLTKVKIKEKINKKIKKYKIKSKTK